LNRFGNVDSKFRFVILASKRAKQLLKGAKPKIKTKSKNPIRLAQAEVRAGAVEYEILPTKAEEFFEPEERVFVGEGIPDETLDADEGALGKDVLAPEDETAAALEEEPEETEDDSGEEEEESGEEKDE
jgi:DNA-directed RNA polymerase omega subunit